MNKRLRVKALALMLMSVVSMGSLAGCGGKEEPTTKPAGEKTETSKEDKKEDKKSDKKSDKPVELVWWAIGNEPKDFAMVQDEINKYTQEKLNVKLNMKYSSWGDFADKTSKVIQSGENFDIVFGSGVGGYEDLAAKGYFADLTDILPTITPDLFNFIPEELWKGVTINDQIIGVPAFKDSSQTQYWVWDKELVEELDIDYTNIKTLEELEPALRKVKEHKPNEYPLILQGLEGINGFIATVNGFDEFLTKPSIGVKYDDPSATVNVAWEDETVMNNLRTLHKWFNEGLINPDAATLTESPKYRAVASDQGYPHADADWSKTRQYQVVSNPYFGPAYSTRTIQGSFLSISAGSKNVEEALQVIELINTDPYMRNLLAFGLEGTHYEKTGDNTIKVLNDGYQAPAYSQGTFFNMYVVDPAPATKWTDLQAHQENATASPALGFTFNTESVKNQVSACINIESKYRPSIITGTVNPDEVVPKMLDELYSAGLQDIIDEAQNQLNAFLGK